MIDVSTLGQLPIGIGIGVASVMAPWLLRPFVVVALVLLGLQGGLLYAAGGAAALNLALSWLTAIASGFGLALVGVGIGRIAAEILFGRR